MITENVSTLKIHKLSQTQYDREVANGTVESNAIYITPDDGAELKVADISDLTATATELNYVDGVTSNVQTQLNNKVPTSRTVNGKALSSNISLTASDIGAAPYEVKSGVDFNNMTTAGMYTMSGCTTNSPSGGGYHSLIVNHSDTGNYVQQIAVTEGTCNMYVRYLQGANNWSAWKRVAMADEVGGSSITVDSSLSSTSTNPVQNKVINSALNEKVSSSSPVFTGSVSLGRESGTTVGSYSVAMGNNVEASGHNSHAEGSNTTASGDHSHAEGYGTEAIQTCSHTEGESTTASGMASHAEGGYTNASGNYSHAGGFYTYADAYQYAIGVHNDSWAGRYSPSSIYSDSSGTSVATVFMVGCGTSSSSKANAFRTKADGTNCGLKAFQSSGADFAEYFEWLDGNPNNEDRRGRLVTLDGTKIKLANADDDYILGAISTDGAFIGNSSSENWQGKYMKDIFGEWLTQEVEIPEKITVRKIEKIDEETGEKVIEEIEEVTPAHTAIQYVINPDYDPEQEYVSREFRKEWSPVGFHGQVVVVDDGTCQVNSYCKPSVDGIATASNEGYRVMARLDETHIKVLIR